MINVHDAVAKMTKEERVAVIVTLIKDHVEFMQTMDSAKAVTSSYHVGFFSGLSSTAIMFGCIDMIDTINIARDEAIKELYDVKQS